MVRDPIQKRIVRVLVLGMAMALVVISSAAPALAEDLKGRWYFGGNLGFLSTTDDIRSNSAIIIGMPGDDGVPFTGDPNEDQGCPINQNNQTSTLFCDAREDDLLGRENTIEETFKLDLTAGYGVTSWLSLQLDVSYFKGDVGPVDAFRREAVPFQNALGVFQGWRDRDETITLSAGEITEIPVTLTGVFRFRKDSPLNPYVGVGGGFIFTELESSDDLADLNLRLGRLNITGVLNERGQDILSPSISSSVRKNGDVPMIYPVAVDVEDAFTWHIMGGAEWFFNDRFSMVFDARYQFADQEVTIDLNGEDQVDFTILSEGMFRKDGSTKIFSTNPNPPTANPVNPANGTRSWPKCSGVAPNPVQDVDGDGRLDLCYDHLSIGNNESRRGENTPVGVFVVQGGKIDLSAFSAAVGVRFHF